MMHRFREITIESDIHSAIALHFALCADIGVDFSRLDIMALLRCSNWCILNYFFILYYRTLSNNSIMQIESNSFEETKHLNDLLVQLFYCSLVIKAYNLNFVHRFFIVWTYVKSEAIKVLEVTITTTTTPIVIFIVISIATVTVPFLRIIYPKVHLSVLKGKIIFTTKSFHYQHRYY